MSKIELFKELNTESKNKLIIAGPCSIESEDQILKTVESIAKYKVHALRGGIWKPRTRPGCFEGVGTKGLKWLKDAGNSVNLPVAVEAANPKHIEKCLEYGIDILWIGARTTTSPFAIQNMADALRGVDIPVLVKNPINPDLSLWLGAIERINDAGVKKVAAIHRGFSSYYKKEYRYDPNWKIPIELRSQDPFLPILCDSSHICGRRETIPYISQKAMDLLFDGLMIEVHIDPDNALSDSKQQLKPEQLGLLLDKLIIKTASTKGTDFKLEEFRTEIDEIDYKLITILEKRAEVSRRIGKHKKENNISLFQPERWKHIVQSRKSYSNLSEEFITNIFQEIHQESIRQQEE